MDDKPKKNRWLKVDERKIQCVTATWMAHDYKDMLFTILFGQLQ